MNNRKIIVCLYITAFFLMLTGCSRKELNRQIAESIGTLGLYEDDEPVESPKMIAEKQMRATKEAIEMEVTTHIENSEELASHFDYYGALDELAQIQEDYQDHKDVIDKKLYYQKMCNTLEYHAGSITHFSVGNLVVDKNRAFTDPEMGEELNKWTLTVEEFRKILQQLYDNDYILMNITDIVSEAPDEKNPNSIVMTWEGALVPEGKKPIILSFTGAGYDKNYYECGLSNRMVLDRDGKVKNEYTDAQGKTQLGAYDVVPILEEFIAKHPDFALRDARGILAITGYKGAFGYNPETDGEEIKKIADKMKADGWVIACQGYSGMSMESELDGNEFTEDLQNWIDKLAKYVGDTEFLIYPNGEEVPLYAFKHLWALEHGFHFFFNLWATTDTLNVYDDCLRQSRRVLDGYDLYNYGEEMGQFFDYKKILDKDRPEFE